MSGAGRLTRILLSATLGALTSAIADSSFAGQNFASATSRAKIADFNIVDEMRCMWSASDTEPRTLVGTYDQHAFEITKNPQCAENFWKQNNYGVDFASLLLISQLQLQWMQTAFIRRPNDQGNDGQRFPRQISGWQCGQGQALRLPVKHDDAHPGATCPTWPTCPVSVCTTDTPCLAWPADNSEEAAPYQSLGNHRYRLTLPANKQANTTKPELLAVRATLPWRGQDNISRPLAVRALPLYNKLPFVVLHATTKECDLMIKPTPINVPRQLPRPFLQNGAYKLSALGPEMQYVGSIAHVNGTSSVLAATNGSWPGWGPHKAMDGLIAFDGAASMALCEHSCDGWNCNCPTEPCGEEYMVIDLDSSAMVDAFALWSVGDGVHDAKYMSLHAGSTAAGPWQKISSFKGTSKCTQAQIFSFTPTFSRFFKWIIHDRYSLKQAYVMEVQLRAAITTPPGYLPNYATRANESTVIGSTGAEQGAEAWKVADGIVAFRVAPIGSVNELVGEGWNAAGVDSKGANFVSFDLGRGMHIIGFALYAKGDVAHDPDEIHLQTSPNTSGTWNTVVTVHGKAGDDGLQEFGGFSATSRYWRVYIASTHMPQVHQAQLKEIFFKPSSKMLTSAGHRLGASMNDRFEPANVSPLPTFPTAIEVYYQPYLIEQDSHSVSYQLPKAADTTIEAKMAAAWAHNAVAAMALNPSSVLNISTANVKYEARGPNHGSFNAYTAMERVATAEDCASMIKAYPEPVLLFVEPRERTIRMRKHLPLVWTKNGPSANRTVQLGTASRNEYFVFQIGIYAASSRISWVDAVFTDLTGSGGGRIHSHRLSSPNLGGRDSRGAIFTRSISVEKGEVGVIFVGVNLTSHDLPQQYIGNISLIVGIADGTHFPMLVTYAIELDPGPTLVDRGDSERTRLSRLRWLDSSVGLHNGSARRFAPLQLDALSKIVSTWSTDLIIGDNGLPSQMLRRSLTTDNNARSPLGLLAQPMILKMTDSSGRNLLVNSQVRFSGAHMDTVEWTSEGCGSGTHSGIRVFKMAHVEADGYTKFTIQILNTGADVALRDIALDIPLRREAVPYFMGLGKPGGIRPPRWMWRWKVDNVTSTHGIANNMMWIGDVNFGFRLRLRGEGLDWDVPLRSIHSMDDVPSWGGSLQQNVSHITKCSNSYHCSGVNVAHNISIFNGGVNVSETDATVLVSAFTGPQILQSGSNLSFVFELQLTPTQPFTPGAQLRQRYAQLGGMDLPTTPAAIVAFVDQLFTNGIRTVNIHQGANINRYINWPFSNSSVHPLTMMAKEIHKRGGRLKLYYTTRELSTRVDILWPLRSLGTEILDDWTGPPGRSPGGMSWLQEHLRSGYQPCWAALLGNGTYDTSVCDVDSASVVSGHPLQEKHRWYNYYVEGLRELMANVPHIDGTYLDGCAYDRLTAKRVRDVMDECNPNSLIDFHGGNSFADACTMLPNGSASGLPMGTVSCPGIEKQWACYAGCVSPALVNMDHMPYLDYTLFGELFNYDDNPPDYWLIEISSIPYGLMGEMLGAPFPANPWRGMLYGMGSARYGPFHSVDKKDIWHLWDRFNISYSEMIGYWNKSCPVRVVTSPSGSYDCSKILATVYLHKGERALVSVASWANTTVSCALEIEWDALGFQAASMVAQSIPNFQNSTSFSVAAAIPVSPARGWLLWLEPFSSAKLDDDAS